MTSDILQEFEDSGITTDPVKLRSITRRIQRFMAQKDARRISRLTNLPKRVNPNPGCSAVPLDMALLRETFVDR